MCVAVRLEAIVSVSNTPNGEDMFLSRSAGSCKASVTGDDVRSGRSQIVVPEFAVFNMADLNGPKFWELWKNAGGDPDEYVKDTLPNFGIVGALMSTITIPMMISPPAFAFGNEGAPITKDNPAVFIYLLLLTMSTVSSIAMIVMSVAVIQQYVNAYNEHLRIEFAMKFGFIVTIFTSLTIIDMAGLLGAIYVVICFTYNLHTSIIAIVLLTLGSVTSCGFYVYMTLWNSNNYSKSMPEDIKANRQRALEQEADMAKARQMHELMPHLLSVLQRIDQKLDGRVTDMV
eukprot:gene24295-29374_t